MLGTLTDKLIAGGLAAALTISVAINVKQAFVIRDLKVSNSTLYDSIHDEDTGFIDRLAQCRSNTATLGQGISDQNAASASIAARGASAKADAAMAVAEGQGELERAQREADEARSNPLNGATACERAEDVDRKLLESLR